MTPDDIERANQRLAGAESFAVTPARYLGHYVTAVLAARHDIEVALQGSVVVGIAAGVELPAALLTERHRRHPARRAAPIGACPRPAGAAGAVPVPGTRSSNRRSCAGVGRGRARPPWRSSAASRSRGTPPRRRPVRARRRHPGAAGGRARRSAGLPRPPALSPPAGVGVGDARRPSPARQRRPGRRDGPGRARPVAWCAGSAGRTSRSERRPRAATGADWAQRCRRMSASSGRRRRGIQRFLTSLVGRGATQPRRAGSGRTAGRRGDDAHGRGTQLQLAAQQLRRRDGGGHRRHRRVVGRAAHRPVRHARPRRGRAAVRHHLGLRQPRRGREPGHGRRGCRAGHHRHAPRLPVRERHRGRQLPRRGRHPRLRRRLGRLPDHRPGRPGRPAADPGAAGGAQAARRGG